jgi:hypothetical protein
VGFEPTISAGERPQTYYALDRAATGIGSSRVRRLRIGHVISTVKDVYDLVLLAKEGTVIRGVIDRLTEIGKCFGMGMNV